MNIESLFRQAGVGAGPAAQEQATGTAPDVAGLELNEESISNFIPLQGPAFQDLDDDDDIDEVEDPRDAQIAQLMAMVTQLTEAQSRSQQPAPQQAAPPAPIDFMAGYDPVDAVERMLADPNAALAATPFMRQQAQIIENLFTQMQNLQGYVQEQQYLQKFDVSAEDRQDHFEVMKMAAKDQQELLRLAASARKAERLEAAKAAEGLKTPKRKGPLSPTEQMQRLAKRQAAVSNDPVNNILSQFAARQARR